MLNQATKKLIGLVLLWLVAGLPVLWVIARDLVL